MCALGLLYGGQLFDIPGQLREPLADYASERARQAVLSGDVASAQSWDRDARSLWSMLAAEAPADEPQKWWAEGQIAEADGLWREAALAYGRGAAVAPDPYDFWMRQGYAYEQVPDTRQASASYQRASQARPSSGAPYLALGTLERNSQHYEEAIRWYTQAAALMPDYAEPLGQIGYTYFISGRYAEARPYFESVLARTPNEAWSAYYLSQVLKAENDVVMALAWLERAVASSSQQPWDWAELLGDWRLAQGDVSGALEAYRTALGWNPGDSTELKLKVGELQSGRN
jgi:tetratricopeptide (TPR) repeat protein